MRKISSIIFTFLIVFTAIPCFAAPTDIAATISQNNFVDIMVWIGIAIFTIGMLFILLSIYLGLRKKSDIVEEYDVDYDDMEDDVQENTNSSSDDEITDEPIVKSDVDQIEQADDAANDETPIEPSSEVTIADNVENDFSDSDNDNSEGGDNDEKTVKITISGLNNSDVKFALFTDVATLGRKPDNDIIVADNAVSGTHCQFTYEDGKVYIEDLNSTNGTMLNDEIVSKSEISNGDTLILGKCKYCISLYF